MNLKQIFPTCFAPWRSPKCDRLNHVQSVGKVAEVKMGEGSFVKYDIFVR